ncbi:zinc finger protein ZPR1-like protein [Corchorus olitorius]|uniref:Zinc finger protein ZPR1-like protein n=1 Tax=Corchorus olitorius TaxID=93759 RepID=A0A1R3L0L3_9ROSI|nr:zinc finger protein ZPR1-like protein [Corchorus olitorius]
MISVALMGPSWQARQMPSMTVWNGMPRAVCVCGSKKISAWRTLSRAARSRSVKAYASRNASTDEYGSSVAHARDRLVRPAAFAGHARAASRGRNGTHQSSLTSRPTTATPYNDSRRPQGARPEPGLGRPTSAAVGQ